MKKTLLTSGLMFALFTPIIVCAQRTRNLNDLIALIMSYFTVAIYLILGLAVLLFIWNVFKYFIKGGDDVTAKKEAGLYVMWSVVGFFVILSIWGLVNILIHTFNLDDSMPSSFFGALDRRPVFGPAPAPSGSNQLPGPVVLPGGGNN